MSRKSLTMHLHSKIFKRNGHGVLFDPVVELKDQEADPKLRRASEWKESPIEVEVPVSNAMTTFDTKS
jgi:hypothetical protein